MLRMNNRIALGSNLGKSIGNGTTNRYFTTLDGAADYYTIPTVTFTGDFEVEVDFSLTSLTGDMAFISQVGNADYFRIDATNGGVDFKINGNFRNNDGQFTVDNKLHTAKFERVGNTISCYYDGVVVNTNSSATYLGNLTFAFLGVRGDIIANFFNGIISDVKITDGTDLIRYYKIDKDLSATSTIIDSGSDGSNGTAVSITSSEIFNLEGADWLGAQLLDEPNFDAQGNWNLTAPATISGGELILTAYPLFTFPAAQNNITTIGYVYQSKITVSEYTDGGIAQRLGTNNGVTRNAVGTYIENITAAGNTNAILQSQSATTSTLKVSNNQLKRILEAP